MPRKSSLLKKKCFINKETPEWAKDDIRNEVCRNLPIDFEYHNNFYCLMHYPDKIKTIKFVEELKRRISIEDYNLQGVYFPIGIYFNESEFKTSVNFRFAVFAQQAEFNKSHFEQEANFHFAVFEDYASFDFVTFEKRANFQGATFKKGTVFGEAVFKDITSFSDAKFFSYADFVDSTCIKGIYFDGSKFEEKSEIDFANTKFQSYVSFDKSVIKGSVHFGISHYSELGDKNDATIFDKDSKLDFQYAKIENPKQISFDTMRLEPNWFVNVDASKFTFFNCIWKQASGKKINVKDELNQLKGISNSNALLTRACQYLADNYEENKGFEEASMFRQIAMESKRLERVWWQQPFTLHWWYWLSSLYGESWIRAIAILAVILLIFSIIFILTIFQVCPMDKPLALSISEKLCEIRTLNFGEAFLHSFATATFQNVEYQKPLTLTVETLRIVEKILVPLQAALLALAIRRKFMR